ncbi:hybrid sensor histidine kinase/response regulator [Roseiconus lacunae]|uniref:ATP-binding protein n=1 Tax=Roseiconus lacunae TaxID=2605694 RepID=UPI0011F39D03
MTIPNSPLSVLLIDDSLGDAMLMKSMIEQTTLDDVEVTHESSSLGGLERLAHGMFDCLLLDYSIDELNGLELLSKIRSRHTFLPVVMVTGNGSESIAVMSLKEGAQDYVSKPQLTPESVERAICNAIDKMAMATEIADKQRELESFAQIAGHDLRSPISILRRYAELLLKSDSKQLDEDTTSCIKTIHNNATYALSTLDGLLEYARSGRKSNDFEVVDLNGVVAEVIDVLHLEIADTLATISVGELPAIEGDRRALRQLFQNLITNAIKFCKERSPEVTIESANASADQWTVTVRDNGIGIASENYERIFAPFKRLNLINEFEGSGIGLAICNRIVQQHQGSIDVESELGIGSTFKLVFPNVNALTYA